MARVLPLVQLPSLLRAMCPLSCVTKQVRAGVQCASHMATLSLGVVAVMLGSGMWFCVTPVHPDWSSSSAQYVLIDNACAGA